jgi:hypothetical protein
MIKDIKMRLTVDPRGKIKTGQKSDKGFPQSLDHFNVEAFPELQKEYGNKPIEIFIYVPSDTITDFFDCEYNTYGSNNQKKRSCDGENCIHRINEEINNVKYVAGELNKCICPTLPLTVYRGDKEVPNPDICKYVAYFRAWIAYPKSGKVENPLCYLFETHSKNSGDAIYSELDKIKTLNHGTLRGVPFKLSVKMVSGKMDAKTKFPIWSLLAIGMISDIQRKSNLLVQMNNKQLKQADIPDVFKYSIKEEEEQK